MALKLLHTSDWHLGKKLMRLERLPEQELFLAWLLQTLTQESVDHLLIAGDIFDVPQPPHRGLRLFYDFLARVCSDTLAQVWVIGGNHDSGTLLEAPQALLDAGRVHIWGHPHEDPRRHWTRLPFPGGKHHLDLCALPYFRQHEINAWKKHFGLSEASAEQTLEAFLRQAPAAPSAGRIFMGHHLFGPFEAAGSEQALALSGLDSIPLDWLSQFDYAALGHIHKPQVLRKRSPLTWYCGSPIAMRFSETAPKRINLLSWQPDGTFSCQEKVVPVWRELVRLECSESDWQERLEELRPKGDLPAAVELELRLKAPVPGLTDTIRQAYLKRGIEFLNILPIFSAERAAEEEQDWTQLLKLGPLELFESFYLSKYPDEQALPSDLKQDLLQLLEEERHAPPPA